MYICVSMNFNILNTKITEYYKYENSFFHIFKYNVALIKMSLHVFDSRAPCIVHRKWK